MPWDALLRSATWGATLLCLASLGVLVLRTARTGRPHLYSRPGGDPLRGVVYAFTKGMMPWEKESVAKHPLTFSAGILFHLGIAAAFLLLYAHLLALPLPATATQLLMFSSLVGAILGFGLLLKRALKPPLRRISSPDDFLSNLLVDLFLLFTTLFHSDLIAAPLWLLSATLLLLVIPLGKIRHCVFFFYTRTLFGMFFGRRGVFPGPKAR